MSSAFFISAIDAQTLGKVDIESMSQQTLMELTIDDLKEKSTFQDDSSYFLDVEEWHGIEYGDSGEIVRIHWNQCFEYTSTVHLEYLPRTIEHFNAEENSLSGELDCTRLPQAIREFTISHNLFVGTLNLTALPEGLETLDFGHNKFHGTIDLTKLCSSLVSLELQRNNLSGTVDLRHLPGFCKHLSLRFNAFSGTLDLSRLPSSFRIGKFEGNQFAGDVIAHPPLANLLVINLTQNAIDRIVDSDGKERYKHKVWF